MFYNRSYSSLVEYYKLQKSNIFGLARIVDKDLHKIYHHDKNTGFYLLETNTQFRESIVYYKHNIDTSTLNVDYQFPNYYNNTYNITFLSNKNIYNKFDNKSVTLPMYFEADIIKKIKTLYDNVYNIVSVENGLHCKILRKSESFEKSISDEIHIDSKMSEVLINNNIKKLPDKIYTSELSVSKYDGFTNDLFYCGMLIVPLVGENNYKHFNPKFFNYF